MARVVVALAVMTVVGASAACGGGGTGDDSRDRADGRGPIGESGEPGDPSPDPPPAPTGPVGLNELAALAGGAPAARGAGLSQPPGPVERALRDGFGEVAVAITAPDGTVTGWCVLVAASAEQRSRGLMEVTDLGGYAGMVFVYDEDSSGGYWMRNTPLPLSIGWFDAAGELVSVADMDPCPDTAADHQCPVHEPDGPYRFALEVPRGDLERMGVTDGSRLALGGSCATG